MSATLALPLGLIVQTYMHLEKLSPLFKAKTASNIIFHAIIILVGITVAFILGIIKNPKDDIITNFLRPLDFDIKASLYKILLSIMIISLFIYSYSFLSIYVGIDSSIIFSPTLNISFNHFTLLITFFAIVGFFALGMVIQKTWVVLLTIPLIALFFWNLFMILRLNIVGSMLIVGGLLLLILVQLKIFEKIVEHLQPQKN